MKTIPRSGQNHVAVPLAWEIFDHLDTGLRRLTSDLAQASSRLLSRPDYVRTQKLIIPQPLPASPYQGRSRLCSPPDKGELEGVGFKLHLAGSISKLIRQFSKQTVKVH
ncbi:MAG: hypothetical protein Q7U91_04885, partial [Sideroxyarcus sp.]|nr:hypothetical protein [Sideroxyarcus sp.]